MLTDIANAHRAIMSDPPANALFAGFGDIGMKFELKAYVADVFEAVFVASELRISIDKAFKQAGIRIPSTAPPVPKIVPPKL
jgi:small-conductance mechanosensitive channel